MTSGPASRSVPLAAAVLAMAALVMAALLAGCGAGSTQTPRSTATRPPTPTPSATALQPTPSPSRTASVSATPTSGHPTTSATPRPTATVRSTPPAPAARRYAFPVRGCRVDYARSHHHYPATDMFAAKGCAFVAPVAGTVDEVSRTDTWRSGANAGATRGGLFVSVVGDDGVRYYGAHLSSVAAGIRPGVRVRAGTLLGQVGTSGSARGTTPHLHFGISWPTAPGVWWVRRGEVPPWPYLDSWRAGGSKSPAAAVAARHRAVGDGPCTGYC